MIPSKASIIAVNIAFANAQIVPNPNATDTHIRITMYTKCHLYFVSYEK